MTPQARLVLPALKARMGDWNYYLTFMRMTDINARVSIAEEIHTATVLKELLQRGLKDRAPAIAEYLLTQDQRFFNALVVGSYGGSPSWHEIDLAAGKQFGELPEYVDGSIGLLVLSGDETLFAIDGQHRVAGIREALSRNAAKIADEEVGCIFIKGVSASDRAADSVGFERTRRLFTTLNSRAKAVSKRDIIALDEDDAVAIITRHLIEEHPLFREKMYSQGVKAIPRTNRWAITTIVGLYDALDALLQDDIRELDLQKRKRPERQRLESMIKQVNVWYESLANAVPALQKMRDSLPDDDVAGEYRGDHGGHLAFRPLGFALIHQVGMWLMRAGLSTEDAAASFAELPMELDADPWLGLLWDSQNRRILYTAEHQRVATRLAFYGLGGDLRDVRSSKERLKAELAGLKNTTIDSIRLRRWQTIE